MSQWLQPEVNEDNFNDLSPVYMYCTVDLKPFARLSNLCENTLNWFSGYICIYIYIGKNAGCNSFGAINASIYTHTGQHTEMTMLNMLCCKFARELLDKGRYDSRAIHHWPTVSLACFGMIWLDYTVLTTSHMTRNHRFHLSNCFGMFLCHYFQFLHFHCFD